MLAESASHLRATNNAQHLSYCKVAHEVRDRNGFVHHKLIPRMVKTAVRCITPISPTVPTMQTRRDFIRKRSAVPSDPHAAFVVSNVDDDDPNGKYGSITITTLAMPQIPEQMQMAVGAVALQTDSVGRVISEGWNNV